MPPDWETNPERWVERRAQYLSATEIGFRENIANAIAWSELGYSHTGIAKRIDVAATTVSSYLDAAENEYPGILTRTVIDIDGDPRASLDDIPPAPSRECPVCLFDRVTTPEGAKQIFRTNDWGATALLDDADLVCAFCHSVQIDGRWERMEVVGHRARHLANASSSKTASDYRDLLTRGIDTGKPAPTADDAEGW